MKSFWTHNFFALFATMLMILMPANVLNAACWPDYPAQEVPAPVYEVAEMKMNCTNTSTIANRHHIAEHQRAAYRPPRTICIDKVFLQQ